MRPPCVCHAGGIMKCDVIASGVVNAAKQASLFPTTPDVRLPSFMWHVDRAMPET